MKKKSQIVKGEKKEYVIHQYNDNVLRESAEIAYNIEKYSYEDLLELEEKLNKKNLNNNKRFELIDGQIYEMARPRIIHQEILGEIFFQFKLYFKNKKCKSFIESTLNIYDIKKKKEIYNILIPDLQVVCNNNQISENMINGAPSLIVEILSPSSKITDRLVKYNVYQKAGVQEYWIVDIENTKVYVYQLKDNIYVQYKIYDYEKEVVVSRIFKDLIVVLNNKLND